jgi:hypothetical protein
MTPEQIAEITLDAIQRKQFYILPDPRWKGMIAQRQEDLLAGRNPASTGALASFLDDNRVFVRLAANHWQEMAASWFRRTFKKGAQ